MSTTTKHTPGPWAYDPKYVLRGSGGERVGDLDKADAITENRYKQVMADRALMVAAPDMAEALRQIQELAKPGQTMSLSDAIDALCDIWNIACIAEAKATGQ